MAGHAAFVKTDGTVFAHTHPDGSANMPAMMLANPREHVRLGRGMQHHARHAHRALDRSHRSPSTVASAPTVDFPYGFPTPGRYRIFIQMKHAGTVETGVFDAEVK